MESQTDRSREHWSTQAGYLEEMHPADVAYQLLIKSDGRNAAIQPNLLDAGDLIRTFSKFSELSAPAAAALSALV